MGSRRSVFDKLMLYYVDSTESELRKAYDTSGEDGVLAFANLHLVPLMFNDGQETQVNGSEQLNLNKIYRQ